MESPNKELMSALATLLEAGKYSDLTIVCGPKRYAVHRAIVCSRSGFFDGACTHRFREAETGVIDLSEDDPEAVEQMVDYFYRLDYLSSPKPVNSPSFSITSPLTPYTPYTPYTPVSPIARRPPKKLNLALVEDPLLATAAACSITGPFPSARPPTPPQDAVPDVSSADAEFKPSPPERLRLSIPDTAVGDLPEQIPSAAEPNLLLHARVYALAEKYSIMGLKSLAAAKFAAQTSLHHSSDEFVVAAQEVYDSSVDSDRGLRDIVVQTFRAHPELASRKDVEVVVKETPELAWELFRIGWGLPAH